MNLSLWITAGLLAVVFAVGSVSKLTMPRKKLAAAPGGEWVEAFSAGAVKARVDAAPDASRITSHAVGSNTVEPLA